MATKDIKEPINANYLYCLMHNLNPEDWQNKSFNIDHLCSNFYAIIMSRRTKQIINLLKQILENFPSVVVIKQIFENSHILGAINIKIISFLQDRNIIDTNKYDELLQERTELRDDISNFVFANEDLSFVTLLKSLRQYFPISYLREILFMEDDCGSNIISNIATYGRFESLKSILEIGAIDQKEFYQCIEIAKDNFHTPSII